MRCEVGVVGEVGAVGVVGQVGLVNGVWCMRFQAPATTYAAPAVVATQRGSSALTVMLRAKATSPQR